jgi:mRNA interferase MazF
MTRHKIVLVPFPFDELSATKGRPAVCLTDPIGAHRQVVLGFITSRVSTSPLPTDVVIDSSDPGFSSTGLRVPSVLQVHRLLTATTTLIRRELGQLSPKMQTEVETCLRTLFSL